MTQLGSPKSEVSLDRTVEFFAEHKLDGREDLLITIPRLVASTVNEGVKAVMNAEVIECDEGRVQCLPIPFTGKDGIQVNDEALNPGEIYGKLRLSLPDTLRLSQLQKKLDQSGSEGEERKLLKEQFFSAHEGSKRESVKTILAELARQLTEGNPQFEGINVFGLTVGNYTSLDGTPNTQKYTDAANFEVFDAGRSPILRLKDSALFISRKQLISNFAA